MNLKKIDLKKIDKKFYLYLGISTVIMIAVIILIVILKVVIGSRVTFKGAEEKIKNSAITYVLNRKDLLPAKNEITRIEFNSLVEAKLIKPFEKLLKDKTASCTAYVTIENNNENYVYIPYLDCGEKYKTSYLSDKILSNGTTTSGDGIYEIEGNYVFRGEKVNNYVSFAGITWRILRINSDKSIRLIETVHEDSYVWDDRYNTDKKSSTGISDYRVSRIKDTLTGFYDKLFSSSEKSYIVKQNVCIGKRYEQDENLSNSIECSETLDNQYVSLIQANEFALASIDNNCKTILSNECTNYNYLATFKRTYWTITGVAGRTDKVYKISKNVNSTIASGSSSTNMVIHLTGNVRYKSGDGTIDNPYVIKM